MRTSLIGKASGYFLLISISIIIIFHYQFYNPSDPTGRYTGRKAKLIFTHVYVTVSSHLLI